MGDTVMNEHLEFNERMHVVIENEWKCGTMKTLAACMAGRQHERFMLQCVLIVEKHLANVVWHVSCLSIMFVQDAIMAHGCKSQSEGVACPMSDLQLACGSALPGNGIDSSTGADASASSALLLAVTATGTAASPAGAAARASAGCAGAAQTEVCGTAQAGTQLLRPAASAALWPV